MAQTLEQQVRLYKTIAIAAILTFAGFFAYVQLQPRPTIYFDDDGKKTLITTKMLSELMQVNQVLNISDPAIQAEWKAMAARIDPLTGSPISQDQASVKDKGFRKWNKRRFNFVKEIKPHGFAFGRERIRNMLNAIDAENARLTGSGNLDSLIVGVRVFLTLSDFAPPKRGQYLDVMFVPVIKNGNSYYDLSGMQTIKALTGNDMLLNTSSPCPDMCDE